MGRAVTITTGAKGLGAGGGRGDGEGSGAAGKPGGGEHGQRGQATEMPGSVGSEGCTDHPTSGGDNNMRCSQSSSHPSTPRWVLAQRDTCVPSCRLSAGDPVV